MFIFWWISREFSAQNLKNELEVLKMALTSDDL